MARYCDAKDLRALVPDLYRDAALADSAGGTEADAGLLAAVLESACNEVDALVEGRVRLPLATVPRKLRVAAAYIALELLSIRRGLNLREDAAAKVQWWRTWLSKVGEGELRLDAPAPDAAGAFSGHSSSVAVRPSVTGTHGLMFGLLLAFPLFALVPAETSRAVEARTWAFDLPEAADVFDNPAEMEWAAGESLVLSYAGGALSAGQTARWEVASGTNLWLALGPDAAGSPWTWSLAPTQTCLPSGRYAGRIAVYETDGTEATFARVAALQSIRVHQGAAGLATANPLAVLSDYALLSWATNRFAEVFQDIATNAAAIADLEEAGRQHADALAANADAISALQSASDALVSRADGLDAATNSLGGRLDSAAAAIASNTAAIGGLADAAADLVPRLEQPSATNRAWAFSPTGTAFNALSVGGWEYTETIATDTSTQTVVRTQTGTLSLNGSGITSWGDIVAGCASQDWARQWVAAYVATNHQSLAGYATLADLEGIAADVDLSGVWDGIRAASNAIPSTNALASREWTEAYVATNHQNLAAYATRGYVDDCVGGLSEMLSGITGGGEVDLSGISLQLAGLRVDVDATAGGVSTNAAAIGALQTAAAGLQDAVGGLQDGLGGYLAKTNGDWVAVQSGLWHGLTWGGGELFGAALLVETNQARITGLQTGSGNTAVITFLGSATTNRLQATTNAADWATWNDCTWSYSGRTGTVTVANAAPGTFWRILAVDGAPDRTNAVLVAYAPLYVGDPRVVSNRVATLGDLPAAVERQRARSAASTVPRQAWEDAMNPTPAIPAWAFSPTGTYFNTLSVGGARYTVETNGTETTFIQTGRLSLNGESITSWAQLAAYAEGAEIVPGVATLNGQRGDLSIEAGDNVTITETDGTLVISSEGGGVTALNSMSGPVTIVGANGISVSTASGADNLLIVSGGGGSGGGSGSADTNAIVAAAVAAVETHDFQTLTLGGVARNAWPTGGGGAWTPGEALHTTNDYTMPANANPYTAIGMDTSQTNLVLTLTPQASFQTVVVRKFGAANELTIVGANTNTLSYDGQTLVLDYWPQLTNWYWRAN